jgi:hypothetical protein
MVNPKSRFLLVLLLVANARLQACWCWTATSSKVRPTTFPNSVAVAPDDLLTLTRQTGQVSPSKAASGVPSFCHCRHGFAQAFALDPAPPSSGRMTSGLLKLSCPLLVRAVDELEDEGFIQQFNERVATNVELQAAILDAHQTHATARMQMIGQQEETLKTIEEKLGERGATAFMQAGVAAVSFDNVKDVKCLHAWLGDFLFRGAEASPLGAMVAQELAQKGIDLTGNPACHTFCDPSSSVAVEPPKPRNKQRLKTGKEVARRKRKKEQNNKERDSIL